MMHVFSMKYWLYLMLQCTMFLISSVQMHHSWSASCSCLPAVVRKCMHHTVYTCGIAVVSTHAVQRSRHIRPRSSRSMLRKSQLTGTPHSWSASCSCLPAASASPCTDAYRMVVLESSFQCACGATRPSDHTRLVATRSRSMTSTPHSCCKLELAFGHLGLSNRLLQRS